MKVIWKRPDGFHGANPSDYYVVQVASDAKIWLHKADRENFPFRISGGWQDEEATSKLNQLVNLLGQDEPAWIAYLLKDYHHSQAENSRAYVDSLSSWLGLLAENLKGDHWEMIIMQEVLQEVQQRLSTLAESVNQRAAESNG